jgi:hypothetical protein
VSKHFFGTSSRGELLSHIAHLTSQVDAWRSIARDLIAAAHGLTGEEAAGFTVPPIEQRLGETSDAEVACRVAEWWQRMAENYNARDANGDRCPHCDMRFDGSME